MKRLVQFYKFIEWMQLYEEYKSLGLSVNTIEAEGNLRGWASALETMEYCLKEVENKQ